MPPFAENPDYAVFSGKYDKEMRKSQKDFMWLPDGNYHLERKKQILKKYPQVEKLYGPEPLTAPLLLFFVGLQLFLSVYLKDSFDQWYYYVILYVCGGTLAHAIFLGIHEVTHFLAFKSAQANYFLAMVANFPIVFPYCVSFKHYHFDHHVNLGVEGTDGDLPTKLEAILFHNVLGKVLWATCQILFYALRPMITIPKGLHFWHFVNFAVQGTFVFTFYSLYGIRPFYFLLGSLFLAGSLHPCAAHFLSEHLAFVPGFETYSYYGWLNLLSFNVGYHNEHHDFANIAWTRLPKLRDMAPEFYDSIPYHTSWVQVLWHFLSNPNISLFNRIKRKSAKTPKSQKVN